MHKKGFYEKFIKRPMDFILSLIALIVLSPVLLIVAVLVRIKLGSPVLFKQPRPGKNEKIFNLYKFRSMTSQKDSKGNLLPDEIRLTKLGTVLRSLSLDELPSLLNILKGDMSIVGPRPQLFRDLIFMTKEQRRRHEVNPGLTGLAQVEGRNRISWLEKLNYDLNYIDKISFKLDIVIIFKTFFKVIQRKDIKSSDSVTSLDYGEWLLKNNLITKGDFLSKMEEYDDKL